MIKRTISRLVANHWFSGLFLMLGIAAVSAFDSPQKTTPPKKKPLVVFVAGDHEYSGEQTLPLIAPN